jgi:hypothetical protein
MTAQLFLIYLAFVAAAVISISAAYLPRRATFAIITGLAIWLVYVGLFSSLGAIRRYGRRAYFGWLAPSFCSLSSLWCARTSGRAWRLPFHSG